MYFLTKRNIKIRFEPSWPNILNMNYVYNKSIFFYSIFQLSWRIFIWNRVITTICQQLFLLHGIIISCNLDLSFQLFTIIIGILEKSNQQSYQFLHVFSTKLLCLFLNFTYIFAEFLRLQKVMSAIGTVSTNTIKN